MDDARLRFVVQTPHEVVIDLHVGSARVPTASGHAGLRARMEPLIVAVDAGLVLLRADGGIVFVGSAGGLLSCDGRRATLFTPLGVSGDNADAVQRALDRALAEPRTEQQVRAVLDKLEGQLLTELRRQPAGRAGMVRSRP
jgi:F0F1-type ATP synthase epsilon subunit